MDKSEFIELIAHYSERFGVGPPIFGMEEQEAVDKMQQAINTGVAISDTPDKDIPDDAIL